MGLEQRIARLEKTFLLYVAISTGFPGANATEEDKDAMQGCLGAMLQDIQNSLDS